MEAITPITAEPRRWQDVARERGISLRILGELVGRPHSTMLAYSMGKRPTPEVILFQMGRIFGETVR